VKAHRRLGFAGDSVSLAGDTQVPQAVNESITWKGFGLCNDSFGAKRIRALFRGRTNPLRFRQSFVLAQDSRDSRLTALGLSGGMLQRGERLEEVRLSDFSESVVLLKGEHFEAGRCSRNQIV